MPLVCILLSKILLLFNYLLSRAHSSFIYFLIFCILHFMLFVNCSLFLFFRVCMCAKKCDVYILLFSCFFVAIVYISQFHYHFSLFFYISRASHYAKHRLRPVTVDVAWSPCLSVGYNREPWQKRMNRQHAVWVLDSWLVPGTMPYMALRIT